MSRFDQIESGAVAPSGIYDRPYQRIADDLRRQIIGGRWQPGDRLPSQRELQEQHDVKARGTVQRALDLLREEGYVLGLKGSSTRVAPREDWPAEDGR